MIRATANRVIIKKDVIKERVLNGLIMPNDHGTPCTGMVVAVGPGKRDGHNVMQPIDVKVGERVLYNRMGGQPVQIEGEDYVVLYDHDCFAILE